MTELYSKGWKLGGETSGHIICLNSTTTGDGIVSALQVLCAMRNAGKSLHEMKAGMEKFPQIIINVHLKDKNRLADNPIIESAIHDIENTLGHEGRVLLRPSGTEPVVRVMVEGVDGLLVDRLARQLSEVVAREVEVA